MLPTLFKKPESACEVFEALLVYYTIRAALIYTALTVATGLLARLVFVSASRALDFNLEDATGMFVLSLHAWLMVALASRTISALGIPRSASLRRSISAVTLGLIIVMEAVFGLGLYGAGQEAWGPVSWPMAVFTQGFLYMLSRQPVVLMEEDPEEDLEKETKGGRVGEKEKWLQNGV